MTPTTAASTLPLKSQAGTYGISTVAVLGGFETLTTKHAGSVAETEFALVRTTTEADAVAAHWSARRSVLGRLPACMVVDCLDEVELDADFSPREYCACHRNYPEVG